MVVLLVVVGRSPLHRPCGSYTTADLIVVVVVVVVVWGGSGGEVVVLGLEGYMQ